MATTVTGREGLDEDGIEPSGEVVFNPTTSQLYAAALRRGDGRLAEGGPLVVDTGRFTGRSAQDKFIVEESGSSDRIWWGTVNQRLAEDRFDRLREKVVGYLSARPTLYVVDAFAGADPAHRIGVRVITESPYHALFAKTMFIEPTEEELAAHEPSAVVLHAPEVEADPAADGTRTGTFVVLHPSRGEVLIGGTFYAGEIKKSIFTVMNDRLPLEGVFPMHCSANVGPDGDVAVFFGLSGTGKTTLSADPARSLIGDDEHGWGTNGVFNVEGGCYAKVIRLSAEAEPEIFRTTRTFGTVLENVAVDERGVLDLDDDTRTENTRAAYKLEQIANALPAKRAGHPRSVVMLTADAFGILPPLARLTRDQALFYFLSGFTAKLAGTEIGVAEPQPTFSACFGAPFLPRAPPCTRACSVRSWTRTAPAFGSSTRAGREDRSARASGCRSPPRARSCTRRSRVRSTRWSTASTRCSGSTCRCRARTWTRSCSTLARRGATRLPTTRRPASSRRCSATTSSSSEPMPATRSPPQALASSYSDGTDPHTRYSDLPRGSPWLIGRAPLAARLVDRRRNDRRCRGAGGRQRPGSERGANRRLHRDDRLQRPRQPHRGSLRERW